MAEVDVREPSDGFAVAPELAAETFAKLSEVQDAVGRMVRRVNVLGRSVPLGDGYAKEIGDFMARYGIDDTGCAAESLTRFGQEIELLKERIDTALRRYEEQDRAASDGVDCVGGG
ncbi:hypothetical protein ACWGRK_12820 [Saccharomonospora azurea]|uniref:Uncharacterized protein n=1 Tax=Saccharomonospora azurea NA-128 TaxID=882081 RepID=H8G4K4_9PSEU|nr:hypothetical protein [Saccharomonospora azurea]EHY88153.1 hypothetical protein SacazDRAFT_01217 [Saccharomonospora azurea NA-128]